MSEEVVAFDETKTGLSVASLVLGIVGFFLPIGSILALIFGIVCVVKKQGYKGCAIAGIILGAIALIGYIVVTVFLTSVVLEVLALIGIVL